jgi:UDP-glucose 4-epimerase
LDEFISILEQKLGKKAERILLPMQPGDVAATFADIAELTADTGFKPRTSLREGINRFVNWYLRYYRCDESARNRMPSHDQSEDSSEQVTVGMQAA